MRREELDMLVCFVMSDVYILTHGEKEAVNAYLRGVEGKAETIRAVWELSKYVDEKMDF